MAEKIQCEVCGNPATVHLTQIVDNSIHKVDLCEECATQMGVTEQGSFSLQDLISSKADPNSKAIAKHVGGAGEDGEKLHTCPSCGFTLNHFRKTGRLGCPVCYDAFEPRINPVLGEMHRDTLHVGKVPERARTLHQSREEMHRLKSALAEAVKVEDYEEAARLRDRIRDLAEAEAASGSSN